MTATDIAGTGSQQSTISPGDCVPHRSGSRGSDELATESTYHLKWIQWNNGKIPIVMQSRNGPCPLIATMNVLLLREKIKFPDMLEQISDNQLLTYLGECIMDYVPADLENDENAILNLEQNIHDAIEILPKLKTGLDVNIRFTGITDFEYTPECIIFDLLRIPLYHGWLSDPSLTEVQNVIGSQSYNQLVDNIITNKNSIDPDIVAKVLISEDFLERTASQLTHHGLMELKCNINDNEIGILFRNNHFLTIFKRESEIYTLVTDHGFLTEDNIIWETLDNIDGAGRFFDSNFQASDVTKKQVSVYQQQQLENDFLMALSLKEEDLPPDLQATGQLLADLEVGTEWNSGTRYCPAHRERRRDRMKIAQPSTLAISTLEKSLTNQAVEAILYDEGYPPLGDQHDHSKNDRTARSRSSSTTNLEDDGKSTVEGPSTSIESKRQSPLIEPQQLNLYQSNIIDPSNPVSNPMNAIAAHEHLVPSVDPQTVIQEAEHFNELVEESRPTPNTQPATVMQGPASNRRLKSERNLKESNCIVN